MFKTYHIIQQWNNWLTQHPGKYVMKTEAKLLTSILIKENFKNAILIGVPKQHHLLKNISIINQFILSPLVNKNKKLKYIEASFYKLPVLPGSLDLVILPHTLELVDFPRHLLSEACHLLKPGGKIIILGFNPCSFWGLKKWWVNQKKIPWSRHFIWPERIKKWLRLEEFEFLRKELTLFRPPLQSESTFNKIEFFERVGTIVHAFFGGVYCITAKANVIPVTPIKFHWEQKVSPFSITIPKPTLRIIR